MRELTEFMSLVSDETTRVAKIQEEKEEVRTRVSVGEGLSEFFNLIAEAPRIPKTRKNQDPDTHPIFTQTKIQKEQFTD